MKQQRKYPQVQITAKAERLVKQGHPWIYGAELKERQGQLENGGLVDVFAGNAYMGTGFYNDHSKITLRLISRNANDRFDANFWRRRVEYAVAYRKTVMPGADFRCCRLIHGEADQMPGLTVDRYGDILVAQVLSMGMERVQDQVFQALCEVLKELGEPLRGIYLRNDVAIRELEGLEQSKGWYPLPGQPLPESTLVEIVENGVRYQVDVENGQKTGFFLDQKYNRQAVGRIAQNKYVLDCFTHTGSFGLNAALGGAAQVTCADVSASAIEMARENAVRNRLDDRMTFRAGGCISAADRAGGKQAPGLRSDYFRSTCLYQEPAHGAGRRAGLQGDQLEGDEAAAPGRIPGHLLLLSFYERCAVLPDAEKCRPRCGSISAAD